MHALPMGGERIRITAQVALLLGGVIFGVGMRLAIAGRSLVVEPWSDMAIYKQLASSISAGASFVDSGRSLAYPSLLATLLTIGHGELGIAYLAQGICTLLAALVLGLMARSWFDAGAFAPTVMLSASSLTIAQYSGLLLTEAMFTLLFSLWLMFLFLNGRWFTTSAIVAGILAGLAFTLKPSALPLLLGSCIGSAVVAVGRYLRCGLFAVVALASAMMSSAAVKDRVGSPGGVVPTWGTNLLVGNAPGSPLHGGAPHSPNVSADQAPDENAAATKAFQNAVRAPVRVGVLAGIRVVRLAAMNPGRIEIDFLHKLGLPKAIAIAWLGCEWLLICMLCAIGIQSTHRLGQIIPVWASIVVPYLGVLALTFVQTRFRLPLFLLLLPVAGNGLKRCLECANVRSLWHLSVSSGALLVGGCVLAATLFDAMMHILS